MKKASTIIWNNHFNNIVIIRDYILKFGFRSAKGSSRRSFFQKFIEKTEKKTLNMVYNNFFFLITKKIFNIIIMSRHHVRAPSKRKNRTDRTDTAHARRNTLPGGVLACRDSCRGKFAVQSDKGINRLERRFWMTKKFFGTRKICDLPANPEEMNNNPKVFPERMMSTINKK